MTTKVLPQGEWCVVKEIEQDEVKQGRIILAASNKDVMFCKRGEVLLMGPDAEEETDARIGDIVMFHQQIGIPFYANGEKFLMCKGESFYCILKETPAEEKEDE